jgi:triacylglycerol lipase
MTRYPIVLAHGIARFDILRELFREKLGVDDGDRFHYFKGIKTCLETDGFRVYYDNVDFAGEVSLRAQQLSAQIMDIIAETGTEKVHIIAHSMGGLDARHMIVDIEGMGERIASLTTIGTPHLGTSFADFGIHWGGRLAMDALRSIINIDGFADLTTSACRDFNLRAQGKEALNNVRYQVYAGAETRDRVFLPLQVSWFIINAHEGENDGLVSVTSQLWHRELIAGDVRKEVKQVRFPVAADHLNEVGWWDPQETSPLMPPFELGKASEAYEKSIQDIYLNIARGLD